MMQDPRENTLAYEKKKGITAALFIFTIMRVCIQQKLEKDGPIVERGTIVQLGIDFDQCTGDPEGHFTHNSRIDTLSCLH